MVYTFSWNIETSTWPPHCAKNPGAGQAQGGRLEAEGGNAKCKLEGVKKWARDDIWGW